MEIPAFTHSVSRSFISVYGTTYYGKRCVRGWEQSSEPRSSSACPPVARVGPGKADGGRDVKYTRRSLSALRNIEWSGGLRGHFRNGGQGTPPRCHLGKDLWNLNHLSRVDVHCVFCCVLCGPVPSQECVTRKWLTAGFHMVFNFSSIPAHTGLFVCFFQSDVSVRFFF